MTCHHGATRRKKVPKPKIAEEPPLVVNCICCHCEAVFSPFNVAGTYLDRRCPSCGESLVESEYDSIAAVVLKEIETIPAQIKDAEEESRKWRAWEHRFRWAVFKPVRRIFERKAEAAESRKDEFDQRLSIRRSRLSALARSRYYTGEWFQRTHAPLERTVVGPYRITVAYGSDGSWNLNPTSKLASGITAEIRVFDTLLNRVRDPESALHGAQLVPNIYLPSEQKGRKAGKLWSQIDCVLLTRKAAFVIESKRRRRRIVAPGRFEEIWSTNDGELVAAYNIGAMEGTFEEAGFDDESFALNQNSTHAVAFDEACQEYPFERVFEQVVYVGTDSFTTDCREFVDNVNVSWVGHGAAEFADIIEDECEKLDEFISQSDMDALGESMVQTYGDLNQKRGQLHAERLRNIDSR